MPDLMMNIEETRSSKIKLKYSLAALKYQIIVPTIVNF